MISMQHRLLAAHNDNEDVDDKSDNMDHDDMMTFCSINSGLPIITGCWLQEEVLITGISIIIVIIALGVIIIPLNLYHHHHCIVILSIFSALAGADALLGPD